MKRILALTASAMICAALILPANGQTTGNDDRAMSLLTVALTAKNPDIRIAGVKALRLVAGREPFATRLEEMLNDSDVPVRIAAVEALAELKSERGLAALKTALRDKVPEVRFAAAKALFKLNDPEGRAYLMMVLSGQMKTSSGMVAEHIREAKRTLQTPDVLMMMAIKEGIGHVPIRYFGVGYSIVHEIVGGHSGSGRAATALLLGKDKDQDPSVIAALRRALTDKDCLVRAAAVQSLALSGDPMIKEDAAALFVPMFDDKNRTVRLLAAASYLRLETAQFTNEVVSD